MVKKFTFSAVAIVLCLGGTLSLHAQQTPVQIPLTPPKVVNFTELANYELMHPPKLQQRVIEQGEDREEQAYFTKKVSGNAINLTAPQAPKNNGNQLQATSPAPSV